MPVAPSPNSGRSTYAIVLALTLAVFAAVVGFVTWHLRTDLREQILSHEGESLAAVASMELANEAEQAGVPDLPGSLFAAMLRTSKLRGVIALRVFDSERHFAGAVKYFSEDPPLVSDWSELTAGRSPTRLHARESLGFLTTELEPGQKAVPLLEMWVPVMRAGKTPFAGAAQFWSDGQALADEFAELDRRLAQQAALAWLAGSAVIALALAWAFRRLARANRELETRGEDLQRANRELVLAAKTSALGAVMAHLIHEIKNPVSGLEIFMASQAESSTREEAGRELAAASELTRRLRTMINDVVAVLHDEQQGANFELTCAEVSEVALGKARPVALRRGVHLVADASAPSTLPGRRANLASLVLQNLLQNAAEAAPADSRVRLGSRAAGDGMVEFLVTDTGSGLPEAVRARLFQPCQSSKPGGSGLGLALSHQLAQQAGGRLELLRSDADGTCFRLVLPLKD